MTCPHCNGTGKIHYEEPPQTRQLHDGGRVEIGGSLTRPCQCVASLPAIHGRATWWDLECVYSASVDAVTSTFYVAARREVPRNEQGRRVHRTTENACYRTLIDLEGPEAATLTPEDARELAAKLLEAADACERADELAEEPA